MATGSSPSAADEALSSTDEKANFQRLTRLLMRGGHALLREVFDSIHPPSNLPAVLGNPAIKSKLQTLKGRVLTQPEWNCLYNPSGPGTYGKSTDFDISLLYKLLREICSLTPPATGWKDLPNITDHSLGADLVRIRIYRNKIYGHNHAMEVTDLDFEKLWMEISEVLLRIARSISSAKRDEWKNSVEKFFREPLTPDAKECVDKLGLWYLMDMDTKDKLEKLDKKMEQMQIKQEQMKNEQEQRQEQRHMEILIFLESLKACGSAVSSSAQVEGDQLPFERLETRISIPPEQSSAEGTAGLSTLTELQASQQNIPVVLDFWYVVYSFKRPLELLIRYLKIKLGVDVQSYRLGSLVITVSCSSLEVLDALWNEYRTGRLNEVVQDTLVTRQVLEKLDLSEVKLRTIISEGDYLSYKGFLNYRQGKTETKTSQEPAVFASKLPTGKGKMIIPQVQGSPAMELVEGKAETKSSQEPAVFASKLPAAQVQDLRGANSQAPLPAGELQEQNLQRQLREMQQRVENSQSHLQATQQREENLQRQLTNMQQRQENLQSQLQKMQEREENSQRQLREMQQHEENSQKQLTEIKRQQGQLHAMHQREENLHRQLTDMQQRQENLQSQLQKMQEREENSQRQLREMQQHEENSQEQLKEMKRQQGQLHAMHQRDESSQKQLTRMRQQQKYLQSQLQKMQEREENSQRQLREMQQQLENSQQQVSTLERQLRGKDQEVNELVSRLSLARQTMSEHQRLERCDWIISCDEIQMTNKCLGRGGWGSVYEGVYCGCTVAVKQVHDLILSPHNIRRFEREMNIASKCRHPHLLQFIGATNAQGNPLFVTELMEKSLRTLLEQRQLSETEIAVISLDVALALNYLHQKKPDPIIHRHVSSANVLLWRQRDQWRGKVSDYGTANFMHQTMTVAPGAMIYSAPETRTSNQTLKVDVYSFGVLLCEMCSGQLPDPDRREEQAVLMTNGALRGLVRRCLQTDPGTRPTMQEIIDELSRTV